MTSSETQRFLKAFVLPHLTDWVVIGPTMFIRPVGSVWRSVTFQAPAHGGTNFNINAAARPLYVPPEDFDGVIFGDRIGAETWSPGREAAVGKRVLKLIAGPGMRILNRYATPERILANGNRRGGDPYLHQAVGCSLLWLGRYAQAVRSLDRAREELRDYVKDPDHGEWGDAMLKRIDRLRRTLLTDAMKAKAQLTRWAAQTAEKKHLTPYL